MPSRSMSPELSQYDDTEYEKPLQHKRPFGAGIKRKRVDFVPESVPGVDPFRAPRKPTGDIYLSIVLPKQAVGPNHGESAAQAQTEDRQHMTGSSTAEAKEDGAEQMHPRHAGAAEREEPAEPEGAEVQTSSKALCPICHLPTSTTTTPTTHASSVAHQLCLPHSHPPSALDRHRKGLTYLSSYGWDPDARVGLGAQGDGRLYPVRAKAREGKLGVGAEKVALKEEDKRTQEGKKAKRRREEAERKRMEKMRMLVLGREDVNEILGVQL